MVTIRLAARRQSVSQLLHSLPSRLIISALALLLVAFNSASTRAATLTVAAGGNLQAAINSAQPGDTIVVEAGASFTGPFTPSHKGTASGWINNPNSTPPPAPPPPTG